MAGKHYVDNKELFRVLSEYIAALDNGEQPPIPEYVGECLLQIATKLSNKPNFFNYTYKEDMISDALENCILYLHNFDPKKSQNPFAYFTQIIHFAFIRRIEKEKKNMYVKYKYALKMTQAGEHHTASQGETYDIKDPSWTNYENIHDFIHTYEQRMKPRASKVDSYEEHEEPTDDLLGEEIPHSLDEREIEELEHELETEDDEYYD